VAAAIAIARSYPEGAVAGQADTSASVHSARRGGCCQALGNDSTSVPLRHTGPVPSDAKFVDAWPAVKKELERDLAPLRQRVAASTRCVERFRLRLDMRKMRRRAWRKARGSFIRW